MDVDLGILPPTPSPAVKGGVPSPFEGGLTPLGVQGMEIGLPQIGVKEKRKRIGIQIDPTVSLNSE
jgi:hypothetical protein